MSPQQLEEIVAIIQTANAAKSDKELHSPIEFHTLATRSDNEWCFKFVEYSINNLGKFTDSNGSILLIAPEDVKAVYVNYVTE